MSGLNSALVNELEIYVMDQPEYNRLEMGAKQFEPERYEEAIRDGIRRYNAIPPLSTVDPETLTTDDDAWFYIKQLSAIEALNALIMWHVRNRNPVNDHGLQVDEMSKGADWSSVRQVLYQEIRPDVEQFKRNQQYRAFQSDSVSML